MSSPSHRLTVRRIAEAKAGADAEPINAHMQKTAPFKASKGKPEAIVPAETLAITVGMRRKVTVS